MSKAYQVAAIPVRRSDAGRLEVLLVTSRETRRWIIPKGWPWPNLADHDAAAGEAWEEAGVRGRAVPESIGSYTYDKRSNGDLRLLTVRVYLLEVIEEAASWPEVAERQRGWFSPDTAAELVAEPALGALLRSLL